MRSFRKEFLKDKVHWKHLNTFEREEMKEYFTKSRFNFPEEMFEQNEKVFEGNSHFQIER